MTINNNDEVIALTRLDAIVRVVKYMSDNKLFSTKALDDKIEKEIEDALKQIDEARDGSSFFDAKAAYEALLAEVKEK